jgi:hypothetical protein
MGLWPRERSCEAARESDLEPDQLPLQSNFDFDVGDDDGFRYTQNTQPVIPFAISGGWNLISRTILALTCQAGVDPGTGDHSASAIPCRACSSHPRERERVDLGCRARAAADGGRGRVRSGAGLTGVILKQGTSTYGLLANHIDSVATDHENHLWTLPLILTVSKVTRVESTRQLRVAASSCTRARPTTPEWGIRAFVTLPHPK